MEKKNLVEAYKQRMQIAESVYGKAHDGEKMNNHRKMTLARCLENTQKFLSEAFDAASATQRSDMGLWKKFCLNLTNVALPNLIANDLVIVSPMSSMSGYITYIEYLAATDKGETENGDVFNSPFALGTFDKEGNRKKVDANYTGARVVETQAEAGDAVLAWTPVIPKQFVNPDTNERFDVKVVSADGTIAFKNVEADGITVKSLKAGDKVAYVYDNQIIPQNDIPRIKAEMKSIPLVAKARRIAVYYSQMAAFQAKTDYGFDLGDQLAEKAVGQLSYEIDTEIVELLNETAGAAQADLTWSKTLPVGVNKRDHYAGFTEVVEIARQIVYDRTQRFAPNYMVCASNLIPVLTFIDGWKAASTDNINGPYFAGTLNSLKVYVSPALEAGRFLIGVNGDDYMSSVAVYAPYMPVVPTQLLQYADGGTSQGWSTLYDLKVLNDKLIVAGQITA